MSENNVIGQAVVETLLKNFEMGKVTTLAIVSSPIKKVLSTKCSA